MAVTSAPKHARPTRPPPSSFPIVGIGASAGGLEAFTQLLQRLPGDTGMGFILVQHLDPVHPSELARLLAKATSMTTREVTNEVRVEPNHVYVIPPNADLTITAGVLHLQRRPAGRAPHHSVDFFLESLAADQQERAIGVILSGAANDGTQGLEAIKAEGGITFAQDESARHRSMPDSAIAAGCVDFVLSPDGIGEELTRIARHPQMQERESDAGLRKTLLALKNHCAVDFSLYKSSTVQRRVARRLILNKLNTHAEYAEFLKANTKELDGLYSDLLIGVTSFFRNPEAFEALKHTVFPGLLDQSPLREEVRVWVLGCSTGQEAYSIAMAFAEATDGVPRPPRLQIFATDLNEASLHRARHGLYAKPLLDDLSPERLRRFFVEEDGGYRIIKPLRDQVVFARQNVISDPPFSRVDLVSCRNLLIYLEVSLQQEIIPTLHYALRPGGFLFLGSSESIGEFSNLFAPADKKQRLFVSKATPQGVLRLPSRAGPAARASRRPPAASGAPPDDFPNGEINAQREADRISVNEFTPPGVLIDADLQVVQFRGATGPYLAPPKGKASFDLLKMARKGLMVPLRDALNRAKKEQRAIHVRNVRISDDPAGKSIGLHVIPLKNLRERAFLVLFQPAATRREPEPVMAPTSGGRAVNAAGTDAKGAARAKRDESSRLVEIEREFEETREYLQSVQEQYEAANEELQASNEEVQSANEELQSLNEELETSKEELESTNEELITVNEEMVNRNDELNRLNSDLTNLQSSIHTPILVVGRDLAVRRATAPAARLFNLSATDIGRSLSSLRHNLVTSTGEMFSIESIVHEVLSAIGPRELEVQDTDRCWYSLRVRPFVTLDNRVDGAVIVLVHIDALKRSEQAIREARDYADAIIGSMREPLLVLDHDLRVTSANAAFYRSFGTAPDQVEGRPVYDLFEHQWDIPRLRGLLEEILPRNSSFNDFEVVFDNAQGRAGTLLLNARRLQQADGMAPQILLVIDDVTERLESRATVKASEARYRRLFETAQDGILLIDPSTGRITDANPAMAALLGSPREDLLDQPLWQTGLLSNDAALQSFLQTLQQRGDVRDDDIALTDATGRTIAVELACNLYDQDGARVIQCNVRDITVRRLVEATLRESADRLRFMAESMPQKIFTASPGGDADYFNRQWTEFSGLSLAELRDWGWTHVVHPDDMADTLRLWKRSVDTGTSFQCEHRLRTSGGAYRWHLTRAHAMRDGADTIVMWIGSNTDIDEVKAAQGFLEVADRRKNEFLAILAHELRNPLAPIRSGLRIIQSAAVLPEAVTLVSAMMDRQVTHMVRLVDDLLDVSRISRGTIELRKEPTDLGSVIAAAVESVRATSSNRLDQDLTVTIPDVPLYVDADPTRLVQVIGNLLNNACKFSDAGSGIWLTATAEPERVVIRVRDEGIGLAADQSSRIFEMFTQVDASIERSKTGLGIGLTLVKNLVELHGGTVTVHSPGPGRGTEFVVVLPATVDPPALSRAGDPQIPSARRVLVVDDHQDAADSLALLLRADGHDTHVAHDGKAAVRAADDLRPDVILLDIGLPGMNGYEVARHIRQQPWGAAITLVALTGWGQDEHITASREAGFDAHLIKPVAPDDLTRVIAQLSSRS